MFSEIAGLEGVPKNSNIVPLIAQAIHIIERGMLPNIVTMGQQV